MMILPNFLLRHYLRAAATMRQPRQTASLPLGSVAAAAGMLLCLPLALLTPGTKAQAQSWGTAKTLYKFSASQGSASKLTLGPDGDLYGSLSGGNGSIFKITPGGTLTILYTLNGTTDGEAPSELQLGPDGNFYGCAAATDSSLGNYNLAGPTLFQITPKGVYKVIYTDNNYLDDDDPDPDNDYEQDNYFGLPTVGPDGNLYGTYSYYFTDFDAEEGYGRENIVVTPSGSVSGESYNAEYPVFNTSGSLFGVELEDDEFYSGGEGIFEISPNQETIYQPGLNPSRLTPSPDGNLYGAFIGGAALFQVTPSGNLNTLVADANSPSTEVSLGNDGNYYGNDSAGVYRAGLNGYYSSVYTGSTSLSQLTAAGNGNLYASAGSSIVEVKPTAAETILHSFGASSTDACSPQSVLTEGGDGTFYGTSQFGGTANSGTIYKIAPGTNTLSVLHSFDDGSVKDDGQQPVDPIVIGSDGTFYGTTESGGASGNGTVFKMTPSGALTVLHSFAGGADGANPEAAITIDTDGQLYGTTTAGGNGGGTVFSLHTDGTHYLVQYLFTSATPSNNGKLPYSTLAPESSSSNVLYGANYAGGKNGDGTIFALTPGSSTDSAKITVLHTFGDGSVANDGANPNTSRLQRDAAGDLIGTTEAGGVNGSGTLFAVNPSSGAAAILYDFGATGAAAPGNEPIGGVTLASDGNYYGTTQFGGEYNDGMVYQCTPTGDFTDVYDFGAGGDDGGLYPVAKVIEDSDGNLVGTTSEGAGSGCGIVYKLATSLPNPVKLSSLTIDPSSVGGGQTNATATITLARPAPSGGAKIMLASSNTSAATVPSSITVSANSKTATFAVTSKAVTANTTATITESYNGSTASASIAVTLPVATLSSVTLPPTSTAGGTSTTANRVTISNAPTSNISIALTSSDTAVAAVPSSITISSDSTSHTFIVATKAVSETTKVTITATYNKVSRTATLTVVPGLNSVTLSPASTKGGTSTTANRVYWSGDAAANETVTLKSSNTSVATVPSSVTIASGSSSHAFTIITKSVTSSTNVTLTATCGGVTQTATLTVTP